MFVPQRVKNGVVCNAGALLGTVSASSANLDMVELAYSVGFVRGAVFCCEFKESVGPWFPTYCRNRLTVEVAERSKHSQTVFSRVGKHSTRIDGPVALVFARASRCGAEDGVYN